ncbi:hypothetical protein K378_05849, partial [Streptomyces sp. Amel2xB2]
MPDKRVEEDATGDPPGGEPGGLKAALKPQTDKVVFGVTAALTLGFVLWGAVATDSLGSVSTAMLN